MKAAGLNVPLMGGDGIFDPAFIELAGKTSEGDLATSVGAPTETLPSRPRPSSTDYDGGRLQGAVRCLRGLLLRRGQRHHQRAEGLLARTPRTPSRRAQPTVDAMANVSFDGATGQVAFDEFGDTTTKVMTVYKVDRWQVGRRQDRRVQVSSTAALTQRRELRPLASDGGRRWSAPTGCLGSPAGRLDLGRGPDGSVLPAAGQRPVARGSLRADRRRLHRGLRHRPADQLRPRRDLHDRGLRRPRPPGS